MAMGYGLDEEKEIMNDFLVPSNLIPISDLDLGSEKNFFESAVVEKQEMNERLRKALKKKADDHNESVTSKTKKTNVRTLFAVYKRGVGAYRTNPESVRPTVNSEQQWAMARVNSYIYALKNGKFRGGKHDTDLFPEGHPLSSKGKSYHDEEEERRYSKQVQDEVYDSPDEAMDRAREIGCSLTHSHNTEDGTVYMPCRDMDELEQALGTEKQETYGGYPKKAIANAERAIKVNDKYNNPCATAVGKQRAQDIVSNRAFSLSVLKRVYSYLSRAKEYNTGTYEKDDKPVCGTISYNLWGGDAMLNWSERKLKQIEE